MTNLKIIILIENGNLFNSTPEQIFETLKDVNLNEKKASKRVRTSAVSDHSIRKVKRGRLSTADISDDDITINESCDEVFCSEKESDEDQDEDLHTNDNEITETDNHEKQSSLFDNLKTLSIDFAIKYALNNVSSVPLSDLPKNTHQFRNHKFLESQKANKNIKTGDEFEDALINRKKSDFVKCINFSETTIECLLFDHQQYYDLIRFGTNKEFFSILNIDTTFDLGKFYVTLITYRNLSLCLKEIDDVEMHPTFIGPVFIHQKRDKSTYIRFASELKQYDVINLDELDRIIAFISDDDPALHEAFKAIFPCSDFMLCCNHLQKDISRKLKEFKVDEPEKQDILKRIFGQQNDRSDSLIGSKTKTEFEDRANELLEHLEKYNHPTKDRDFSKYFENNKLPKIYNNFLKIKWKFSTKLNDFYTTNDIEGINNKLKY